MTIHQLPCDRLRSWAPWFVGCSAMAAEVAALAHFPAMLRAPLVFWFVLTGPGTAVAHLLNLRDALSWVTVTFAAGMAIAVMASEAMVLTRLWSPNGLLVVLALVATSVVVLQPLGSVPPAALEVGR